MNQIIVALRASQLFETHTKATKLSIFTLCLIGSLGPATVFVKNSPWIYDFKDPKRLLNPKKNPFPKKQHHHMFNQKQLPILRSQVAMGVPNKLRQPEPIHHTTADVEDFQVPPTKLWNFEVSRVMPPKRQRSWKINLSN